MANLELHSKMYVLDGLVVPKFIKQETLDKLKGLTLRSDDVWIVSYPKAGTTWTQYIVHLIHNGGEDDRKKISDTVPWIESGNRGTTVTASDLTPPRAFKSHMPYDRMPKACPILHPANTSTLQEIQPLLSTIITVLIMFQEWSGKSFWNTSWSGKLNLEITLTTS